MKDESKITLEKARIALVSYTGDFFDDTSVSLDMWGEMTARVLKSMLIHKISNGRIQYPENWKEAFKERWFPDWIKKRFPVRYKKHDAYMIFPDLLKKYKPKDGELYLHYDGPDSILKGKESKEKKEK